MCVFDGLLTIENDTRPPFIQARDLNTFWGGLKTIHRDRFNKRGKITLDVENIIINDKTYKGPIVLTPEDMEAKNITVYIDLMEECG